MSFFRTTHQATLESKDSMFRKGRIKPEKKVMPRVALRECFLLCLVLLLSYWPYTWEFLLLPDAIFLSLKSLVTGILLEHAYLFLIVFVIYFFFFFQLFFMQLFLETSPQFSSRCMPTPTDTMKC